MTPVIETEGLTKSYGTSSRHHRHRPRRSRRARRSASSAPTAPARRRRSGPCSTTSGRRRVGPASSASTRPSIPSRSTARARLSAGRVRPVRQADRRPDDRILRQPARRGRSGLPGRARSSASTSTRARKFSEYSKGNKQKIGLVVALQHRPDLLILDEPTSGLDPLVQQTFYEVIREAKAEGRTIFLSSHILSEVEKTCDRVAIIRDGRLVKVDRVEALRDLAHHQVELALHAAPCRARAFDGLPGVSDVVVDGPHPARCGSAARSLPVVQAAARYELVDFVSREPSLEETFLAEYAPRRGRGGLTWRPTSGSRRRPRVRPDPALDAALRARQRLRQDHPRLAPGDDRASASVLGLVLHRGERRRSSSEFATPASRQEMAELVWPPCRRSCRAWPASRSMSRRSAGTSSTSTGRSSRSSSASGRSSRCRARSPPRRAAGSLEFVAADPMTRRRIALEKLFGHVVASTIAMAVIFVSIVDRGQRLRDPAGRRDLGVDAAAGYAIWLGLLALAAGSVAFAHRAVPRPWGRGRHRRRDHVRRVHPQRLPGRHPAARPVREPDLVRLDVRPPPARRPVRLGAAGPRRGRR